MLRNEKVSDLVIGKEVITGTLSGKGLEDLFPKLELDQFLKEEIVIGKTFLPPQTSAMKQ